MKVTKKWLAGIVALVLFLGIIPIQSLVQAQNVVPDAEVTISGSVREDTTLWFNVSSNDPFEHDPNWGKYYIPVSGGVYVDGEKREDARLYKLLSSEYIINFPEGMSPVNGTVVKVDGVFVDYAGVQDSKVKFGPVEFVYDGNEHWAMYSEQVSVANVTPDSKNFRFQVTPSASFEYGSGWETRSALYGGIYLNDSTIPCNLELWQISTTDYLIYWADDTSITINEGATMRIDGVFGTRSKATRITSDVYEYKNGDWVLNQNSQPQQTEVAVSGSGKEGETLWFTVGTNDPFEFDPNWGKVYTPVSGGVSLNGESRDDANLYKLLDGQYIIYFEDGMTPEKGMVVTLNGVYEDKDGVQPGKIKLGPVHFVYDGTRWHMYDTEVSIANMTQRTDPCMLFTATPRDPLAYHEDGNWYPHNPVCGGIYVNNVLQSDLPIQKISANEYFVYWSSMNIPEGTTVKIDGIFGTLDTAVKITTPVLEYRNGVWGNKVAVPEVNTTVAVYGDARNEDSANGIFFTVDPQDPLEFNMDWSKRYSAYSGGVSVDGVLHKDIQIIKLAETLYLIYLPNHDITPVEDMKVTIDGVFGDANHAVKYLPTTFEYCGNGKWKLEGEIDERDLTPDKIKVYDLFDVIEVSQATLPQVGTYELGQLKESVNVAFKAHVSKLNTTKDEDNIAFGLSKHLSNSVWANSGYQIFIQPHMGRISIASEEFTILKTVDCAALQEGFDIEYGVVNLRDSKGNVLARKIYAKINGEEVIYCVDWNPNYQLGTYIPIYSSLATETTIESLTHKGYVLVEEQPVVQDISELNDGLRDVELAQPGSTYIGTAKSSTNVVVKAKMKFNKPFTTYSEEQRDSVTFGFSKVEGIIWDSAESGYQVELRPEQILILHEMSTVATSVGYDVPQEFILEIGTCDVNVYKDGNFQKFYGRKVFVKIDGVEVASWMDRNVDRVLGKEWAFYQTASTDASLTSLTSDKTLVREQNKVYDLHDASGYPEIHLNVGSSTPLGSLPNTKEVAFKAKVKIDPESTEFKFAISKKSEDAFWDVDASGWQFGFRPSISQVSLLTDTDTIVTSGSYDFPENGEFILEIGQRNVKFNDGKQYAGEIYMKIDGKEVLSWLDKNSNRNLGNYVIAYVSVGADVTLSTLYDTTVLPITYVVNGEETKSCDYVTLKTKVVPRKTNKLTMTTVKDPSKKIKVNGFYLGTNLIKGEQTRNTYEYVLENPKKGDSIKLDLSVTNLEVDEAQIFDLYDISGKSQMVVQPNKGYYVGGTIGDNGTYGVNTAFRVRVTTPESYLLYRLAILGDAGGIWSYNGVLFTFANGSVHIRHPLNETLLEEGKDSRIKANSSFILEVGAVKCYEEGVYKYDRYYVKVGETQETLELVAFYDSTQRGSYGAGVTTYGGEFEGNDFLLSSLKDVKTIEDISKDDEKAKLAVIPSNTEDERYAIYYPKTVVGGGEATIKFYTKEGMALKRFTVAGKDVTSQVYVSKEGCYSYDIEKVNQNIKFTYEIMEDATHYQVTAKDTEHLTYTILQESVPSGGKTKVLIQSDKGYVLSGVSINGTDYTEQFKYSEKECGWVYTLKGIRENMEIDGTAEAKSYKINVTGAENADLIFSGDATQGIIPAGGTLEIKMTPNEGWRIYSVAVNGHNVPVSEAAIKLEHVYSENDALECNVVLQKAGEKTMGALSKVAIAFCGVVNIGIIIAVVLIVKRQIKKRGQ